MRCWCIATSQRFLSTPSARRATHRSPHSHGLCDDFYPRPPRGGRLPYRAQAQHPHPISIHALREEGDGVLTSEPTNNINISIHALREEGDGVDRLPVHDPDHFYPRPPRGGRRTPPLHPPQRGGISIHALREEGDFSKVYTLDIAHSISIHALREEGDSKNREKTLCFCLIIHRSAQIAKRCL